MTTKSARFITIHIDRQKLGQTLTVLPMLLVIMSALLWIVSDLIIANSPQQATLETSPLTDTAINSEPVEEVLTYPVSGSELNPNLFSLRLPPPPLDAFPYDIREPLSNGTSVAVKKRWVWMPPGQQITVSSGADGQLSVNVPEGAMWWKEFYIETDRGTFLIERRIIVRVRETQFYPDGWAFYSSHYVPSGESSDTPIILPSTGEEAEHYMFQPAEWLPTQSQTMPIEVRFEDIRGVQYPYLFPGEMQCMACHGGSAGAYPNTAEDPILVFGLHPNNLTPESFTALVERGWISNGDLLLTPGYLEPEQTITEDVSFEALTSQVVGVMRNNCASCHNSSTQAAANMTAFIIDPNRDYSSSEFMELLNVDGRMFTDANPLVTPGQVEQSEIWLRINGLEGRRRMPPREGGLPEIDPHIVDLFQSWIIQAGEQ